MDKPADPAKIALPNVTMPSGGGSLRGISEPFKSTSFTGSGGFTVPFALPDARGFSPGISLACNSGSGNGLFGLGFSIAMDSVVRKTSTGVPRYDGTDVFMLGSAGELLPKYTASDDGWEESVYTYSAGGENWEITAYRPRIEGSFNLVEHWINRAAQASHWKVVTADNITHLYGMSANGRIFNPAKPAQVFEWLIESSCDPHGNKILYSYKPGDTLNIPAASYNSHRDYTSQRYPDTIQFGNYFIGEEDEPTEEFAFEVVFDYGQINKNDPDAPASDWIARPDIFSTYKSGFEIRTARLCYGIYLRHNFTGKNNGVPFTTAALLPEYEQTSIAGISIIKSISSRGYRIRSGQPLWMADTPATKLTFQEFDPLASQWQVLKADAPGYMDSRGFTPVDLDGIGIDGLLYSTDTFTGYLEPLGNGNYAPMRILDNFPVFRNVQSEEISITSLDGNSVMDVLVNDGAVNGFFEHGESGWKPFQPFTKFPQEYFSQEKEMADLSGAGRTDLLFAGYSEIKFYSSEGKGGFTDAGYAYTPAGFPVTAERDVEELTGFADFFGDGLSHRFRLRNGDLTVWPSLGHGNFGEAVALANGPLIDGLFDSSRVFLMDADGSGTTDIIYCFAGFARIWFNQNGNGFASPVDIIFPATYSSVSSVTSGDVTGYGTASLIFTTADPDVRHFYYDFSNKQKPYLLQTIDNGAGGLSSFTYTTSVLEQLADKQQGRIWPTRLPMPVSIVSQSTVTDRLTGAIYTSRYRYHDGYFDPVEREFRGFGFVESWDCESYEAFASLAASRPSMAALLDNNLWAPPVYTREWFITGAYEQTPAICAQYQLEFFNGDAMQWNIPAFELDITLNGQGGPTIRQAYASLAGSAIRTEVYAEDGSSLQPNPYTVSMSTTGISLIQPRINERYCCLIHSVAESLDYTYDRNPQDPLISQSLVLLQDKYGQPLLSATVNYPRRNADGAIIYPEQQVLRLLVSDVDYINSINSDLAEPAAYWQYIGLTWQARGYEIGNAILPDSEPFTRADLLVQVTAALQQPIGPVSEKPENAWSRLLSWDRSVYWNDDGTAAFPYGKVNQPALLHHTETAVLDPAEVSRSFGDKVDNAMLTDNCGYVSADGYWWNYGQTEIYNWSPLGFYLPASTQATIVGIGLLSETVLDENGFNGSSSVMYDDYSLVTIQTTSVLSSTISISQNYTYDYQAMAPVSVTDANNNISEVLYDPLGRVIVSSIHGEIDGKSAGDIPLDQYDIQTGPTFNDVIADPAKYLQGATAYFYYDLFAWADREQPLNDISITRAEHVQELTAAGKAPDDTLMPIGINYSNGAGGSLQSKTKTTPGNVALRRTKGTIINPQPEGGSQERWTVSGYTIYNNKGEPVEQYLPYFSTTPDFEDQQAIIDEKLVPPPTVTHYDPISRVTRVDSPKGFFTQTIYSTWETKTYDYNDTMPDSPYYQWFTANYPQQPEQWQVDELAALNAALPCYNTPATAIADNKGNAIRTIACNLGAIGPDTLPEQVASPMTPAEAWNALVNDGYLAKQSPGDTVAWITPLFQPYLPGFNESFLAQFPENGNKLEDFLAQSCMTSLGVFDIQGRQLATADARLFLKMVRESTPLFNFTTEYGMAGQALKTTSADAGSRWTLANMAGNVISSWDDRGFQVQNTFDNLQRPTGIYASGGDGENPMANQVQVTVYGETATDAANFNLMGAPWQNFDEAGLSVTGAYDLSGNVLAGKARLRPDYKSEANWTQEARQAILNMPGYNRANIYNTAGQPLAEILPDGSRLAYTYNINGLLNGMSQQIVNPVTKATPQWQAVISNINYDATGKRTLVTNGNGVVTNFTYDALTQQLVRTYTTRGNTGNMNEDTVLQDIYYTYDPAGHVISTIDNNSTIVYYNNQQALPKGTYAYDPLYRIVSAQGRTLPGLNVPNQGNIKDITPSLKLPDKADLQKLENYTQKFAYDFGDNLLLKRHIAASGNWSQVMTVADSNNHLESTYAGNEAKRLPGQSQFQYDANGNMLVLNPGGTAKVAWNYQNMMSAVTTIEREVTDPRTNDTYMLNDAEYYQYNSSGNRVRKVTERAVQGGQYIEYTEKIYLGSYQQLRTWSLPVNTEPVAPASPVSEKHTVVLKDGHAATLITHIWIVAPSLQDKVKAGDVQYRYQLSDSSDSVTMEVNENAELLTFEQYYVYGGTSFSLARSQLEADSKELRFCGKEQDIATGLYYYGARYYAAWLCRWMSPDPAGPVDGPNLYEYVGSNPVNYNDPKGSMMRRSSRLSGKDVDYTYKDVLNNGDDDVQSESEEEDEEDERPKKTTRKETDEEWDARKDYPADETGGEFGEPVEEHLKGWGGEPLRMKRGNNAVSLVYNDIQDPMTYGFLSTSQYSQFIDILFVREKKSDLPRHKVASRLLKRKFNSLTGKKTLAGLRMESITALSENSRVGGAGDLIRANLKAIKFKEKIDDRDYDHLDIKKGFKLSARGGSKTGVAQVRKLRKFKRFERLKSHANRVKRKKVDGKNAPRLSAHEKVVVKYLPDDFDKRAKLLDRPYQIIPRIKK